MQRHTLRLHTLRGGNKATLPASQQIFITLLGASFIISVPGLHQKYGTKNGINIRGSRRPADMAADNAPHQRPQKVHSILYGHHGNDNH
jgi:hypothetical protein